MTDILTSFREQCAVIEGAGGTPRRIVFSNDGFYRAKQRHLEALSFSNPEQPFQEFMGLPYTVDQRTSVPIAVLDTDQPRSPVSFRCDQADPVKTNMQIAGELLSKAQLCDVIVAWCDAHRAKVDPTDSVLAGELMKVVRRHGRFE